MLLEELVFMSSIFIMCLVRSNESNMQSNKESDIQLLLNEDQKNWQSTKNNGIEKISIFYEQYIN